MAIRTWDSATAVAASTAAAWTADTTPITADTAIIPSTSGLGDVLGASMGTVDLASFSTAQGCRLNVGTSASPLIIGSSKFLIRGSGSVYIQNDSVGAEVFAVNSPNMDTALTITGNTTASRVNVARGGVTISAGDVGSIYAGVVPQLRNSIKLTVGSGATVNGGTMHVLGGRISFSGTVIGSVYMNGGTFTNYGSWPVTLYLAGGTYIVKTTDAAWTIVGSVLLAGTLDLRGIEVPVTITELFVGPNARLLYDPAIVTFTKSYFVGNEFRNTLAA